MICQAPLAMPMDVALLLACQARDAKSRIEGIHISALAPVRKALEAALGVKFEGESGDRFFCSTFVQTIFYGIFSAWVLWHQENPTRLDKFDWKTAERYLQVFQSIFAASQLKSLGLEEGLNLTADRLNCVNRALFFANFDESLAVPYFYEPFLQAFDPALRKKWGVCYTPPEIVQYMVARVDAILREELEIEGGLANPNVCILDPCCGTGAYLIEVLKYIAAAKSSSEVKEAALNRVFGFEMMTAPLAIAHLQIALLLQTLGVPLSNQKERPLVYLANTLTDWQLLPWAGARQTKPILVILGNPPYNAFAGVSLKQEDGLTEPYKNGLISEWGIKKFNLDDLYVRFFSIAEKCLVENNQKGIICYISSFSYLSEPSFAVMRQHFLKEFDKLWFDCLNGDSRATGKLTPEGKPDPSVFSTKYNRKGIRVGVAIALMMRRPNSTQQPLVRFRHFWGANKRADLLASLAIRDFNAQYQLVNPDKSNRYSFRPYVVASHYLTWPKLVDLGAIEPITGYKENRGYSLLDTNKNSLSERMQKYFSPRIEWEELKASGAGLTQNAARFDAKKTRAKVLNLESYDEQRLMRYALHPFELKWCYYSPVRPLWNEPRPSLFTHQFPGNAFLVSRPKGVATPEGVPLYFIKCLGDFDLMRGHSYHFPLRLGKNFNSESTANLSPFARAYLAQLGIANPDANIEISELIWMHVLAIAYSPAYLAENADGIRQDWLRVPLPNSKQLLLASAELGRRVATLLDPESSISGVTAGKIRGELEAIAPIFPVDASLTITANWGYLGKDSVTMPGQGKLVERAYTSAESAAIQHLGETTYDIYLNDVAHWKNIPAKVWNYTIGGYQVIKKWLSYREGKLLRRSLFPEEAREVTNIARRIAAIVLLEPALDANYQQAKQSAYKKSL